MTQTDLFDSKVEAPEKKKRKKPVMLTGRSTKFLQREGYIVALVERTVNAPRFKHGVEDTPFRNKFDAFGFADLAAAVPHEVGTLWVQVTDHSHHADRRAKILANDKAPILLKASNRIHLHSWKPSKKRGRKLWRLSVQEARLSEGVLIFSEREERWFLDNGQEVELNGSF
jgi:hypothetical protein